MYHTYVPNFPPNLYRTKAKFEHPKTKILGHDDTNRYDSKI